MDLDVREFGKVVGVKYQCVTNNRFNLLTREGRRSGGQQGMVRRFKVRVERLRGRDGCVEGGEGGGSVLGGWL